MEVYSKLIKDSGGACSYEKIINIQNNYVNENTKTIVEIGVYNGCFLLPFAKLNPNILFYGIDPYISYTQNDIININLDNIAKSISQNQNLLNSIYDRLLLNIKNFNLDNIHIIRDFSKNTAIQNIDILHIDGNHDYNFVLNDLNNNHENIVKNGIIVMDDTDWISVNKAMVDFLQYNTNFVLEKKYDTYSILKKI
jgi:hypothetical protein